MHRVVDQFPLIAIAALVVVLVLAFRLSRRVDDCPDGRKIGNRW